MAESTDDRAQPLRGALMLARYLASPWWFWQFVKSPVAYPRRLAVCLILLIGIGKLRAHDPALRLTDKNKIVLYAPRFLSDVAARLAWPINMLIDLAPAASRLWFSQRPGVVWPMPAADLADIKASDDLAKARESILSDKVSVVRDETMAKLFESLEPARANDLIGKTWDGKVVRTGTCPLDLVDLTLARPLKLLGLGWGKRFRSRHQGDALVLQCLSTLFVPVLAAGNTGLVEMDFSGKSQATARYSHQPWNEHYRVLDDGQASGRAVLLGVWCTREECIGVPSRRRNPSRANILARGESLMSYQ